MNSINDILLNAYGATVKNYKKGELIFVEGNIPRFYYQIAKGKVKVFCINAEILLSDSQRESKSFLYKCRLQRINLGYFQSR